MINQSLKAELELSPDYQKKQLILGVNSMINAFMKI